MELIRRTNILKEYGAKPLNISFWILSFNPWRTNYGVIELYNRGNESLREFIRSYVSWTSIRISAEQSKQREWAFLCKLDIRFDSKSKSIRAARIQQILITKKKGKTKITKEANSTTTTLLESFLSKVLPKTHQKS